eukprot:2591827-Amphidinium_carterae.1
MKAVLGPEETDDKLCTLLNRVLLWTETGLVYEADPRHVELTLAETGTLHAKELSTPSVRATPEEWGSSSAIEARAGEIFQSSGSKGHVS